MLNDDDKVWTEVRHMHMKDALDKLIADFKAYAGEHGGKFGGEGNTSLNDMKDMLASLPQLREAKEKVTIRPVAQCRSVELILLFSSRYT